MRRAIAVLVLLAGPVPIAAQRLVVGPYGVVGDYREVTNDLRYDVAGLGASGVLMLDRFAAELAVTWLNYTPDQDGTAAEQFQATQVDGYVRYRVLPWASLEVGLTNRVVQDEDEFRAQSAAAVRLGAHSAVTLGPAAGATARVNYLAGSRFSGGGSASFAMDVGLTFYYAVARGRLRITGESQFQHFNRTIDAGSSTADVPIQQVLGRLGLAVTF